MDETYECVICGETISTLEIENGQVAEMFDPADPDLDGMGGICHAECGISRGWEVA